MSDLKRKYDSTIARIAGNLLSGTNAVKVHGAYGDDALRHLAQQAVRLARAIVAEVERTEPESKA
jgi:hypothetical protein